MGRRGTIILALLTLAAGLSLWLEPPPPQGLPAPAEVAGAAPTREPTAALPPLLRFEPADVVALRLEHGGRAFDATRQSGNWPETEPPGVFEDFLRNLGQLAALGEMPAAGTELKDYGLQPPRSVLQLQLRDRSRPSVLEIGDANPATTGVYVRVDSGRVLLAGALVQWEFEKAFRALAKLHPGS